jgi:hypothetical protein
MAARSRIEWGAEPLSRELAGVLGMASFGLASNIDPLPLAFRAASQVNPITWEVDLMRYGTIGFGNPRRLALEALAFAIFALVCVVITV